MNRSRFLAVILPLALLAACSSVRVNSDYDERASFRGLRGYAWTSTSEGHLVDPAINSDLVARRVKNAIDSELIRRGYERTEFGSADFLVSFQLQAKEKVSVNSTGDYYFGYRHYGRYGLGGDISTLHFIEGTIVIDIVDAATGELIWRGWAVTEMDSEPGPEQVQEYINESIRRILEEFPPDE
jgi:hypothetical protein